MSVDVQTADIQDILKRMPHRYPLLMVDRMLEMVPGDYAVGLKNVTINEPHFQGHFPEHPIMPGVLLVEAMAQVAGILCMYTIDEAVDGSLVYFMAIDKAKFRKPVVPGDTVHVHVKQIHNRGTVWKFQGEARVNGEVHAEAEVTAMITSEKKT